VQWLRFDEPGTYAFAIQGAGVDYRVYSAHDMSTPVPQYYEETITFTPLRGKPTTGKKFHFPEPPYLVKVFNTNRAGTGAYQFVAHRATCNSREDACVLRANETVATTLPGIPINADDTAWFEFHAERADSGAAQSLKLTVDDYAPSKLELYLTRDDGATVLAEDVIAEADFDHPGKFLLEAFHPEVGPSKLYLKVKRLDTAVTGFGSRWETDLTILHGQNVGVPGAASANLFCYVETDGVADIDEVWLTVKVDGSTAVDDVYIGDYDDGSYRTMEDYLGKIAYLSEVEEILREDDGGLSGDDDYLTTTIGGLPADKTQKLNETSTLACCDGEYLLRYNRSRSLLQ
ncbi:MAG: hypothetical protein K8I02_00645, partial [Candidatus Methylomirabilis sp.]|nr:hypothetical protein [Deltaproteobacteria bacterium]